MWPLLMYKLYLTPSYKPDPELIARHEHEQMDKCKTKKEKAIFSFSKKSNDLIFRILYFLFN